MPIKKIFPFLFLIVLAFIGFGFLKPTVESILVKRSEEADVREELSAAMRMQENVGKLSDSLDAILGSGVGVATLAYLPKDSEQERIVDIMNYYSFQSGITLDEVSFESVSKRRSARADTTTGDKKTAQSAPRLPETDSVVMTLGIRGSYEGIRAFLGKMSVSGRYNSVKSLSITKADDPVGPDGVAVPSGMLVATVKAEFYYLPEATYPGAHLLPVFEKGSFDTSSIEASLGKEESVPTLDGSAASGRPNPFAS